MKRKLSETETLARVHDESSDAGDELRSLIQIQVEEYEGVFNAQRVSLKEKFGEMGTFADKLRIISRKVQTSLQDYQSFFVKGVVSEYS